MLSDQRGDTLIEVIMATAVLALIIVISLGIMNGATAQAQRAVEGTFVRQEIDSQTEMLRYARDAYIGGTQDGKNLWNAVIAQRVNADSGSVGSFSQLAGLTVCTPPDGQRAFWLDDSAGVSVKTNFDAPVTFASAGHGLWIEAASESASAKYVDFYIYACWDPPASGAKSTSGTIVRLYVPA